MKARHYKLKREVGLWQAVLYGVGIILGAGIYVLIGEAAGIAGNAVWLSFVVAAFIALFTAMSYAELASMYPKTAAEYVYTKHAFNRKDLSFVFQWIMVFIGIVSAATVAHGFGRYFAALFSSPALIASIVLIVAVSLLSYRGIKSSANFNTISTLIEMAGLVIIAAIGTFFLGSVDYFAAPNGLTSIFTATTLVFFAYIGFEEFINISEETKNPTKTIPRALIISLIISTALYILVSLAAVSVVGWEVLSTSPAPLATVAETAIPNGGILLSFIALFATANTVLVILVVVSRMLFGLARDHSLPKRLATIGKRGTPGFSVFTVMILAILALFIGGIATVAKITDVGLFVVYMAINAALITLRYTKPNVKRPFKSPLNIGRFPVLALLGLLSSALLLAFSEPILLVFTGVAVLFGIALYKGVNRH